MPASHIVAIITCAITSIATATTAITAITATTGTAIVGAATGTSRQG